MPTHCLVAQCTEGTHATPADAATWLSSQLSQVNIDICRADKPKLIPSEVFHVYLQFLDKRQVATAPFIATHRRILPLKSIW
jgi:hypothetical protein